MINLVEITDDNQHDAPCKHGNIVDRHACYCHHPQGLRKCPIWRNYGEHDLAKWHNNGDWNKDSWDGGCRYFEPNAGTQRPGSPDGSLATETRKPGWLK
jgi:hypothetical protein